MKKVILIAALFLTLLTFSGCLNIPREIQWANEAEFVGLSVREPEFKEYLRTCRPGIWQTSAGGMASSDYVKIKWVEGNNCLIEHSAMGFVDYKENYADFPITDYICKIPYNVYSNPANFDFYETVERYCQETGKRTFRISGT